MSTKKLLRALTAVAIAAATLVGVAACGERPPKPQGAESSTQTPDITEAQEKAIRKATLDVLDASDNAKSPDGLSARVTGPALEVRTSELSIAQATGAIDPKATIPKDIAQTIIPTQSGWPRSVFSITTTTQDQQSKRLLVMTQRSPRTNYKLWGVVRLFQGAKLPEFAIPSIGANMGTPDDSGLSMTPQQAVDEYADVLTHGQQSKFASKFNNDYFRDDLDKLSATVQQGMERNHGTQTQAFMPIKNGIAVMRSSEGGDLVVSQINSEWTRIAGEGRESQPASDAERALFGQGKATGTMKVTYVNILAFYVPPAKSGKKVVAVGAERQPIKVEAL
ncbi:hypothetical protein OZX74_01445 [Bifidobacterium sp. ESL0798]|uniref:hypothetical protein n=1 Tax=unclassified Bifidobacterium TaxID=2608897 RepID=UPI0023F71162|nr:MULTISPECIES: hypothetical protein [unclassified Bifidobacterium]WEV52756.1 hypothetical protein OZX64_07820 [Bifidobacterium sp. ESL0704]WEV74255.1 hypothetical protein OZX74_01445 [Bifidobacterium sp. ESL0798]